MNSRTARTATYMPQTVSLGGSCTTIVIVFDLASRPRRGAAVHGPCALLFAQLQFRVMSLVSTGSTTLTSSAVFNSLQPRGWAWFDIVCFHVIQQLSASSFKLTFAAIHSLNRLLLHVSFHSSWNGNCSQTNTHSSRL